MTKTYLHAGVAHTDTSTEYMAALGMDEQTQAAVLAQLEFEELMDTAAAKKARDAAVAKIKVTVNGKTFDGDADVSGPASSRHRSRRNTGCRSAAVETGGQRVRQQ